MADFEKAIDFVLKNEGGYVNHPDDPGGETKYGIAKRSHPSVDIKNLTVEGAKGIYLSEYWIPSGAGNLSDALALVHFDTAVNCGVGKARVILDASKNDARDYLLLRIKHYAVIIAANPKLSAFLKGWINRCMDLYQEIKKL
jgi:lysozyme family protein